PAGHVAAVRAAEDPEPLRVDEIEALDRGLDRPHQILVVDRAPAGSLAVRRAANRAAPVLRVAGRAARVRVDDGVARARIDLELIEEAGRVLRERTAVDRQQRRVLRPDLVTRWLDDPAVDLRPVGGARGEALGP